MSLTKYLLQFVVPAIILLSAYGIAQIRNFFKWRAFAKNHIQVAKLSDSIGTKYYQCDPPKDGQVDIYEKRVDKEGKETKVKIGSLAVGSLPGHSGQYPPHARPSIAATITEYYCDESYIPVTMKPIDPLETAQVLMNICNSIPIKAVLQITERVDELNRKIKDATQGNKIYLKDVIQFALLIAVLVFLFLNYRNQDAIIQGLKALGVLS